MKVALVEDATLLFQCFSALNISNLLPQPNVNDSPFHACIEILEDLLPNPLHIQEGKLYQDTNTWYTDGSYFVCDRIHRAGYAIVADIEIGEAGGLPAHTTNEQVELIAITHAFQLAKGRCLNVYTDSKYASHILLSDVASCKEYGLLTMKRGAIMISG